MPWPDRREGGRVSIEMLVFAGILVLTAFALLLDLAVTRAEQHLLTWHPGARADER